MRSYQKAITAALVCVGLVPAQTSRGAVTGTVSDPSGAFVENASVELVSTTTGVRRRTVTNRTGTYAFEAVDLGAYELEVARDGFTHFTASGLGVNANRTLVLDIQLTLGTALMAVQVNASNEVLSREGPLRGGNFTALQASQLPLSGLC